MEGGQGFLELAVDQRFHLVRIGDRHRLATLRGGPRLEGFDDELAKVLMALETEIGHGIFHRGGKPDGHGLVAFLALLLAPGYRADRGFRHRDDLLVRVVWSVVLSVRI